MAKQEDFIRTQVRMPEHLHDFLKKLAQQNNMSMNDAILLFLEDAFIEHVQAATNDAEALKDAVRKIKRLTLEANAALESLVRSGAL